MPDTQDSQSQGVLTAANALRNQRAALLALLTIVGIVLYVVLDVIAQLLPPHYSPIGQAESDLAVGPYGFLMTINFVLRGLLSLALVWALTRSVAKEGLSRVGLVLVAVWGVGALLLALFPTDIKDFPGHITPTTLHGIVHLLVAGLAFICAAVGELLLSLRFANDARWRSLRYPAAGIAILAIITLFIVPLHLSASAFGLYERIFIGLVLFWMLVVAFRVRFLSAKA